jgi:hypothetical protein
MNMDMGSPMTEQSGGKSPLPESRERLAHGGDNMDMGPPMTGGAERWRRCGGKICLRLA